MENGDWPYALVLQGKDRPASYQQEPIQLHEERHFNTLRETFNSLLSEELYRFNENVPGHPEDPISWERAWIRDVETDETLMEIVTISFEDSPEGMPSPGLYMYFENELDMHAFLRISGLSFRNFEWYDDEMPMVCIARLQFGDSGYSMKVNHGWSELRNEYIKSIGTPAITWNYKIVEEKEYFYKHSGKDVMSFHFNKLSQAFAFLIHSNLLPADEFLCMKKYGLNERNNIALYDLYDRRYLAVKAIRDTSLITGIRDPGIYFYFPAGHVSFSKHAGIEEYFLEGNDHLRLWMQYDQHGMDAALTPAAEKMRSKHRYMPDAPAHKSTHVYEIRTHIINHGGSSSIERETGFTLQMGVDRLLNLPAEGFDKRQSTQGSYYESAGVYLKDKLVISKHNAPVEDPPSPPQISYFLYPDTVSLEILSIIIPRVTGVNFARPDIIEITIDDNQTEEIRHPIQSQRNVQPGSEQGPKL